MITDYARVDAWWRCRAADAAGQLDAQRGLRREVALCVQRAITELSLVGRPRVQTPAQRYPILPESRFLGTIFYPFEAAAALAIAGYLWVQSSRVRVSSFTAPRSRRACMR
jgi:hypothetical protein